MTQSPRTDLAAAIETTVRAVPGVTAIFRSGGTPHKVLEAGARLVGLQDADAPLVRVEESPQHISVDVAIGVGEDAGAVATTERVRSVVAAVLPQDQNLTSEVRITVVHIDEVAAPQAG